MAPRHPKSFRLSEDEQELIDAWAAYIGQHTGVIGTTSSVIRYLMRRTSPPERPGDTEARVRRAYTTIFGKEPT